MTVPYQQGVFPIKHPEKYKGSLPAIYRSKPEFRLMKYFDTIDRVVEWGSESVIIPYIKPVDGKVHRYYIDFYCKFRNPDGTFTKWLIEYKPYRQTIMPVKGRKSEKTWLYQEIFWATNMSKFKAATEYAHSIGAKFQVLTEKDLPPE